MSTPASASPALDPSPIALTFILPTRNRRQWVGRAIESCLDVGRDGAVAVEVLVIDGHSTDGSFEELQQRYKHDPRVHLVLQQSAKGFMPACFFAVPQVHTPYATFMYDDDVLSPFWGDLAREMRRSNSSFALGFSAEGDIAEVIAFEPVRNLRTISPSLLLRAFCGCGHDLSPRGLPFSPICCLTRTDRLREWMQELDSFCRDKPLRHYFMLVRNAGPDLMIYFYSILRHQGDIPILDDPVAQFSAHQQSITSGLEKTDLPVGYWLAHVWLSRKLLDLGHCRDGGWCAAYTVKQGLRLALKRISAGRGVWLVALVGEVLALAGHFLTSRAAIHFLRSFCILLSPRRWRPSFGLSRSSRTLLS